MPQLNKHKLNKPHLRFWIQRYITMIQRLPLIKEGKVVSTSEWLQNEEEEAGRMKIKYLTPPEDILQTDFWTFDTREGKKISLFKDYKRVNFW